MPRLDLYHHVVKRALEKDGWLITHDPLILHTGIKRLYVDLGAARLISAEKAQNKIAVEIKSFVGASDIEDLEKALGQYVLYHKLLGKQEPDRQLYIAVTKNVYEFVFRTEPGELFLIDETIRLIVFDEQTEEIQLWLPS
jgi:hypothetical protein